MVGTPFEKTHIPLYKWFYAIYLFTTTRHGVAAKELERMLGVSYPTAWRMTHKIRQYMAKVDGTELLSGHIEVDETYVGGKAKGKRGRGAGNKTIVFGMLERNGSVKALVVPNVKRKTLTSHILQNVARLSTISSDEWIAYKKLGQNGFAHHAVNHSAKLWADGIHHTNGIEGFWSQIKRSIRGTHVAVSGKYLPAYLAEFQFRYNMRHEPERMFGKLVEGFRNIE
jgi:transposase-like protein